MPRKARSRNTWRASSDNWRASGNWMDMSSLRLGLAWALGPNNGSSNFHAGVIGDQRRQPRPDQPPVCDGGGQRRVMQLLAVRAVTCQGTVPPDAERGP